MIMEMRAVPAREIKITVFFPNLSESGPPKKVPTALENEYFSIA